MAFTMSSTRLWEIDVLGIWAGHPPKSPIHPFLRKPWTFHAITAAFPSPSYVITPTHVNPAPPSCHPEYSANEMLSL